MTIPAIPHAEFRVLFEALGFHTHRISFDHGISDANLRKALKSVYGTSAVTLLLQNLPDLFVLHPEMSNGIFFVRFATKLSAEEAAVYKQFYPTDLLLASINQTNGERRVACSWIGNNKQVSLLDALKERFGFKAPARLIQTVAKSGWRL